MSKLAMEEQLTEIRMLPETDWDEPELLEFVPPSRRRRRRTEIERLYRERDACAKPASREYFDIMTRLRKLRSEESKELYPDKGYRT